MDDFVSWVGRSETTIDCIPSRAVSGLAALLDYPAPPWPPGIAPPLGHFLAFPPMAPQSSLGADGHPVASGILPAIDLPRRMWAGSRIRFLLPLPVDRAIVRHSTVLAATPKTGRSGRLLFVTLAHEYRVDGELALEEEQDLVFRGPAIGAMVAAAPAIRQDPKADHVRRMIADPVQLFRYSALTFNGHRIHYDRDYARNIEHYPGLVVHGPYLATLLVDHFARAFPERRITAFRFRAERPVFDGAPFDLCLANTADGATLWVRDQAGDVAVTAELSAR
jgi:3-methylfumaryl-CoA hydratase